MPRLSIPRRYPGRVGPPGERQVECAYCGIKWYRSDCVRDASGYLVCPDDQDGRDTVTLDRANARELEKATRPRPGRRLD